MNGYKSWIDGRINEDKHLYNLELLKDISIIRYPVSERLIKQIGSIQSVWNKTKSTFTLLDFCFNMKRCLDVDLSIPIIIHKHKYKSRTIDYLWDGVHRYIKAYVTDIKYLPAKIIDDAWIKLYEQYCKKHKIKG
jgi:hypothetical protein